MTSSADLPVPYALTPEGLELTAEFTVKLHLTPEELAATYAAPAQLALDLDLTAPSAEVAELVSRRPAHPDDVAELARLLRLCRRWSDPEVQARFLLASNWGQASLFGSGSEHEHSRASSGRAADGRGHRPGMAGKDDCTCTTSCPESENTCPYCCHLDIYDPCPVVGFGCGTDGGDCDCCTPAQMAAAAGRTLA